MVYLRDNPPPDRDVNAPADPGKLTNMAVTAGHGNGGTTPTKPDADRALGVTADVAESARAGIASGP